MQVKKNVLQRYSAGAKEVQESLCCPVNYDQTLLKILPQEIIEKDYGCGDPSRYVKKGDTVLDLGSGGGKICYMAAQLVGETGSVIGIDFNEDMLRLARKYQNEIAGTLGQDRVEFKKGHIQDLALDLELLDVYLKENKIQSVEDLDALELWKSDQKQHQPLVADGCVDLVVSNCVLNLVSEQDRVQMIEEIFRVLKPGGRVAISDIVADQTVTAELKQDEELWSGCISGAFQEQQFIHSFVQRGFVAVGFDKWDVEPWQVVEGIEFRSVTLTARKPLAMADHDIGQAALYKGPYREIVIDGGQRFCRGERVAISEKMADSILSGIYADDFVLINPKEFSSPKSFCASNYKLRPAAETGAGTQISSDIAKKNNACC